ncbi:MULTISPECIES: hypothetical protein [unclassified Streptomyces]|uniref:hypothetical protein n=1 Tax=unclassified Streptomyces TaxID=2593676 RepID=UPI001E5ED2ED|nr:hypothetical protein [Streptomyces sp. CB02980]MCB8907842.1 hypothetical protein [Streptomyces sp. CB02980]
MSNDQYYGGQQYDPYANGTANGTGNANGTGSGSGSGHQEQQGPDVTQTWEGQTWDTQFQPAVTYEQVRADRAQAAQGRQGHQQQPHQPQQQQPYEAYASSQASYESYGTPAAYYAEPQHQQPQPPQAQPQHQSQPVAAPAPAPAPVAEPVPAPPAPSGEAGPGWSSPTTSGNTRITDAQRARAEGRSPVIEPGMQPAALTAVLGLLLAGGAALGTYALLVPLVVLQGLTAAGWFRLNGMWPARQGIALAFAGGLAADAALLVTGRENAAAAIFGTLGVWVLLCLVLQLRSHADPDERMYGLMATIASAALAVVATGHLGADPDAVVVGGVAVAAAVLARALPLPGPVSLIAALLASAGAGIAAGGLADLGSSGALLGLGAGVCALVGLRVASYDYPSRFVHMTAGVALPLTAAAPAVYLLGRALV